MFQIFGDWSSDAPWTRPYQTLYLHGGSGRFISEDDEDMIEIYLPNGFMVDVGYCGEEERYYITTAAAWDWNAFHRETAVSQKERLPAEIQAAIDRAAVRKPPLDRIKGVIFDMDGVLVDSERLYLRFWREACAQSGFTLTEEQALDLRSNAPETAIPKFAAWFGEGADYWQIRETRRRIMAHYIDRHGVALKKGADALLPYLKGKGYRIALATASPVRRAAHYLEPHGLFTQFDAIVSGGDVARGKPAPDIYLCAAQKLGLPPADCLAVEDSPSGIRSAHDAGCLIVMVPDLTPPESEILPLVSCLAQTLTDLQSWL